MAFTFYVLLLSLFLVPVIISSSPVQDPELVVDEVHKYVAFETQYWFINWFKVNVLIMFFMVFAEASMGQEGIWVTSLVGPVTPLMTAGSVTPIGRRIASA